MATRTVLLVRHGKAQSRSADTPDSNRKLTKAGVRALRAWLPKSAKLFKGLAREVLERDASGERLRIEVWTSPATRARQTAEEVVRTFGLDVPVLEHESLLQGAYAPLRAELVASEAPFVIIVGHGPFLENALYRMTGARVDFAPGAVAAAHVPLKDGDGAPAGEPGHLLWFVQGASARRWKTALTIEKTMRERAKAVEARLEAFLADPDDVEALHKLRVSIRTVRSLLAFMAPFLKKGRGRALQHDLRALVSVTSRLREYDVLAEQVSTLPLSADEFIAVIGQMRAEERDRAVAALSSRQAAQALSRICKGMRELPWAGDVRRYGIAPEQVDERFAELVRIVDEGLGRVDFTDADAVHDVRKDAKRVRYVAECLGCVLGSDAAACARRMVAVQDQLGAICDARVNTDIVCTFPTQGLSPASRRVLGALLERNMSFIERFLAERGVSSE